MDAKKIKKDVKVKKEAKAAKSVKDEKSTISRGAVKDGSKVQLEYEGKLEDGTVFDASRLHGQPLEFTVGGGQVIKGFDEGVLGLKVNQEKEIKISPKEGYGEHNPNLLKEIPREKLPKDQEPKEGMMLALGTPDGQRFPAKIVKVNDTSVTIDLNHPLAGKTLLFKVKVVKIE